MIIAACMDPAHRGHAAYEHCRDNGGGEYVARQVKRAQEMIRDAGEMTTDLGNARRLVRLHGNNLRFVPAWKSWISSADGRWQRDEDGAIVRMAKATIEQMFTEAAQIGDEAKRAAMRSHALKSQSQQRLAAMVKLAESELEVVAHAEKLDADPYLLGVRNGVIDLQKVEFRQAKREDYVTKVAGVAFDANAQCPQWLGFLKKIFPQQDELITYLQRASGYLLTGLTVEEVLFVLWGRGHNGKTTFRETLFALLGEYAIGSDASLLITQRHGGATPDLARLFGRRLVTINETEQHSHLNEQRVKFITSHDVITARNLFEDPFDFMPTHKTCLTTNYKPIVKGTDEGIWRRIHLWPFVTTIPENERDASFREKSYCLSCPAS